MKNRIKGTPLRGNVCGGALPNPLSDAWVRQSIVSAIIRLAIGKSKESPGIATPLCRHIDLHHPAAQLIIDPEFGSRSDSHDVSPASLPHLRKEERSMKRRSIAPLLLALSLMALSRIFAQTDTVDVPSDIPPSIGHLNEAIKTIVASGTLSRTVFRLVPHGYYVLTGTITVPAGKHLTIIGPKPGRTQDSAPPQLVWSDTVGYPQFNFRCFGRSGSTYPVCQQQLLHRDVAPELDEGESRERVLSSERGTRRNSCTSAHDECAHDSLL